jgi:AraC-like DNA-binding protein
MRRAVEALAAEADGIPPLAGAALATRTVDLVAILLEAAHEARAAAPSSGDVLFRRIVAHIDSNLTDARLGPARIAAAFGISVRTLHKLFHDRDQSVGQRLLKERLKRCHDDLTRPDLERTPIKEIALRAGFRSQAHFASAFRRAYRTTPTALRNAARRGA